MKKQAGLTFLGMIFIAIVVIFVGILVMRVVPVYIHYYEVKNSIQALNRMQPVHSDYGTYAEYIKQKLLNQLYINGVNEVQADQVSVIPKDNGVYSVSVNYRAVRPLFFNISLLFDFKETQEVVLIGK